MARTPQEYLCSFDWTQTHLKSTDFIDVSLEIR